MSKHLVGIILAGILSMGSVLADTDASTPYRRTPSGAVATQAAPVYVIVIDLRHIDAADIALLFGGRFLVGGTSLRYRGYSRGCGVRTGTPTRYGLRPYQTRPPYRGRGGLYR